MLQKKIYIDNLSARMRSAGQENWAFNDMQDICEMADMWNEWLEAKTRIENEILALKAAEKLGVEIRHYVPVLSAAGTPLPNDVSMIYFSR